MKIEKNAIYNVDCLEAFPFVGDGTVDMVLCDLPYGILDKKNEHTKWDIKIPFEPLWAHYTRILKKNGAIVLTCTHPFTKELVNSIPKGFKYYEWIWYKSSGTSFLNAKKHPIKQHENVIVVYREQPTYNPQKYKIDEKFINKRIAKSKGNSGHHHTIRGKAAETYQYIDTGDRYPDTIIEINDVHDGESVLPFRSTWRKGMHPTEKPVDLFTYLIRTYTNQGELVLDNCIGSGTTAVAAILESRNFIGFEKEQTYYEDALQRIQSAYDFVARKQ